MSMKKGVSPAWWIPLLDVPDVEMTLDELCRLGCTSGTPLLQWADVRLVEHMPVPRLARQWH